VIRTEVGPAAGLFRNIIGTALTLTPAAIEPSKFRTTPDRTPVEPGGNAGGRTAIPPNGDGTAAVYREKSTLSTVEPAAIEIALADAMLAVSG
jgi:hypothetical protein